MTWNTLAKLVVLKFAMCHGCFDDMLGHIVLAAKSGCCFFGSSFRTIVPQHPRLKIYSIEGSAVTNQYLSFYQGITKMSGAASDVQDGFSESRSQSVLRQ